MKKLLSAIIIALLSVAAFAQDAQRTSVTVNGSAQLTLYPTSYKVRFFLQEEATATTYNKPVTKTSLDSIRTVLFNDIMAYGYTESDLRLLKRSSTPYNNGANSTALYNEVYELKNIKTTTAEKLVINLRFNGLKGVIARPQYTIVGKATQDSLYATAIKDAHNAALNLAKEVGKTIGEVYNVNNYNNAVFRDLSNEYDNTDMYNLSRFEMNLAESRVIPITVSLTYELKKN